MEGFYIMNLIKNFIYNISDILVALIIIAAAVLTIGWRVEMIMEYPQTVIDQQIEAEANQNANDESQSAEGEGTAESGQTAENTDVSVQPDSTSPETQPQAPAQTPADGTMIVIIEQGESLTSMADKLAAAGAVSDAQTFVEAVHAANATTKLKYGEFVIPAGSTPDAIIQIMMG